MTYDRPDKGKTRIPAEPMVKCDECLREIPRSEAQAREASDYTLYFCGLTCFDKWSAENPEEAADIEGGDEEAPL